MVDIQTVSIMLASASVIAGVIYYALQIRHQSKVRQTDLVMRLYDKFGSTEFQKAYQMIMGLEYEDYADYRKRYGTNAEVKAAGNTVNTFFEGIGVLVKRKLISIGLVDDLLKGAILLTWEKRKPIIEGSRQRTSRPRLWEWFEYLYNEMKKREQQLQQKGVKNG
jgi:hypothetical protein